MGKQQKILLSVGAVIFVAAAAAGFYFIGSSGKPSAQPEIISGQPEGEGQHNVPNQQQIQPMITGVVSSISGNTVIITAEKRAEGRASTSTADKTAVVSYAVDVSGASFKKVSEGSDGKISETVISLSGIAAGDTITVRGEVSGSSVIAQEVTVGNMPAAGKGNGPGMSTSTPDGRPAAPVQPQ